MVPLVRMDRRYRIDRSIFNPDTHDGDGIFSVVEDTVLSDGFWWQDRSEAASASRPDLPAYPINSAWCHGRWFNALDGGGAVQTVMDDGTIGANSIPADGSLADDSVHYATYSERVWQFLDSN